jgi:hypothetical protein
MRCRRGIAGLMGRLAPVGLGLALMGCQTLGPAVTSNSLGMERPRSPETSVRSGRTQTTEGPGRTRKVAAEGAQRQAASRPPYYVAGRTARMIMGIGF